MLWISTAISRYTSEREREREDFASNPATPGHHKGGRAGPNPTTARRDPGHTLYIAGRDLALFWELAN